MSLMVNVTIETGAGAGPRNVTVTNQSGSSTVPNGFNVIEKGSALPVWIWLLVALAVALTGLLIFIVRRRRAADASAEGPASE